MDKKQILARNSALTKSQVKILKGARNCFKQWGIDKTSMNDLAREAGVTRQTVYSYYANKEDVATSALLYSVYELATNLLLVIEQHHSAADKMLEAMIVVIEELPKEPHFSLMTFKQLPRVLENALLNEEGIAISFALMKEILVGTKATDAQIVEVIEFVIRSILSIVMFKGTLQLRHEDLREYLQRYVMSADGIRMFVD